MKKFINNVVKIAFPIFNAYICLFGFLGIYTYAGGSIRDKVGFLFFPIVISMIYGAYIGFRAAKDL
jgi:hypothetical protein